MQAQATGTCLVCDLWPVSGLLQTPFQKNKQTKIKNQRTWPSSKPSQMPSLLRPILWHYSLPNSNKFSNRMRQQKSLEKKSLQVVQCGIKDLGLGTKSFYQSCNSLPVFPWQSHFNVSVLWFPYQQNRGNIWVYCIRLLWEFDDRYYVKHLEYKYLTPSKH